MYDVIVIGGGPGGMSALVWSHRLGLKSLLIEQKQELGGQLFLVNNPIIDYLGIPVSNGREMQRHFCRHVQDMGCEYRCGVEVKHLDLGTKRLITSQGELSAKAVILALGSRDRRLNVPGEAEMLSRSEVYSASRDKQHFTGKKVAVIGGGDRAVEGALLLAEHGAHVTLIHRSERFRARREYLEPLRNHPNVQILTNTVISQIIGQKQVEGIVVHSVAQGKEERILPVEAVFVRIGVEPNNSLLLGQVEVDSDGYVVVDSFGETSMRNVFAIGDVCTRPLYSSVAGSVAQGMMAAKTLSYRMETEVDAG